MTTIKSVSLTLLTALVCGPVAFGAEFYASPTGKPDAAGTEQSPWDLATAFAPRQKVQQNIQPGDTLWLLGGTYAGAFKCELQGRKEAPIVVRAIPGRRVTIDCQRQGNQDANFYILGDWVVVRDLEVTCSNPKRETDQKGSWPTDLDRGGISCRASNVKLINLVVHDLGTGIGFWANGDGGEVYGCMIYHNGWKAPDRAHGHGIYAQNKSGTKRIVDNVIFDQFGNGIQAYGSAKAAVEGFHVEGNAIFNNGFAAGPGKLANNVLIGGDNSAARITVVGNHLYHHTLTDTCFQLGYSQLNKDVVVEGNHVAGFTRILSWTDITARKNRFVGDTTLIHLEAPSPEVVDKYRWDDNDYLSAEKAYSPLTVTIANKPLATGWSQWQASAHLDPHGRYVKGAPTGTQVFVRPNQYEPGRANVIVYNWSLQPSVGVNLEGVLKRGQEYRVMNPRDFFAEPIAQGAFDGKSIDIPMAASAKQIADPSASVGPSQFAVFVVLPGKSLDR